MMGAREPEGMLSRRAVRRARSDDAHAAHPRRGPAGARPRDDPLHVGHDERAARRDPHPRGVRARVDVERRASSPPRPRTSTGTALPLFHVAAMGCDDVGARPRRDLHQRLQLGRRAARCEAMEAERATQFFPAYQPIMEGLLSHPDFAKTDLSALRVILNTCPPEVLEKFQQRIPHATQLTMYGGTEGGPVTVTRLDDPLEDRMRTSGHPHPGLELRVVGEDGARARPGAAGDHPVPRLQHARALLQVAGEDRGVDARRRLGDDVRPRRASTRRTRCSSSAAPRRRSRSAARTSRRRRSSRTCARIRRSSSRRSSGCRTTRLLEVPAAFVELQPGVERRRRRS